MPFFDDSGIVRENHRGPVIGAFATFAEQVERMVAVSVAWSAVLFPALVALGFPGLPGWFRISLAVLSSLLMPPATAALFALAARAWAGEQLDVSAAWAALRDTRTAALAALTPLFAVVGFLVWAVVLTGAGGLVAWEVPLRVAVLGLLVVSGFWGPLLVARTDSTAVSLLVGSIRLTWLRPAATLKGCLAVALVAVASVITVAGAVLAAPMLIALLQTHLYEEVRDE
jgi:hypothetical protein